jgi:hypothetical protein
MLYRQIGAVRNRLSYPQENLTTIRICVTHLFGLAFLTVVKHA